MLSNEKLLIKLKGNILKNKFLPFVKSNLVFGEGSARADIFFIGEAPGAKEDELKRPFVGRSGKLLDKAIESIGLKRQDVYITNIIKRRPPENRDPSQKEINAYSCYLREQINIIKPKIIISLGRFALNYFIPNVKISEVQGSLMKIDNLLLFPIIHPSATFRSKKNLDNFNEAFENLRIILREIKL